ncbi:MAG: hypothetical protein JWO06_1518, partial [Bacteroidota bacterium]|nr:hypothetical protein [Bacteroidota bacterium]
MKLKFLLFPALLAILGLTSINTLHAQSAEIIKPKATFNPKTDDKLKEIPEPQTLSWQKNKSWGDKLFDQGRIFNGLRYYEEAVNKNPQANYLFQKMADGYFALRNYWAANKYYKMLVEMDTAKHNNYYAQYQYALTDKYIGNYEKAKLGFELFNRNTQNVHDKEIEEQRKKADRESLGCDLGIKLRDDKTFKEVKAVHLDSSVNHANTDYAPVLTDPITLVYSSWVSDSVILIGKKEKYATFSRIYKSTKTPNGWSKAEPVPGEINKISYHVGNTAFAADGKTMYYTQCLQDDDQRIRCNICKSLLGDSGWVAGIKLDASINAPGATNTEPAFGKNEAGENVLYFVSDRNKDKGLDLFYAKVNGDGSLGKAQLASNAINSDGDEMTPVYDFQTNTLYFSSNGRVGIGGLDVYKTKAVNGNWSEPENLGLPVNSSVDDYDYFWSEKDGLGFVVSNRPGGYGLKAETYCSDDIYQVYKYRIYLGVKGKLLTADSNLLVTNQIVTLYDAKTGTALKTVNSKDGSYFFDLETDKSYKVSAAREGFFTASQTFSTEGKDKSDTMTYTLSLKKMEKNKAYSLNNIYYEYDKFDLTPPSKAVLDTLYEILKENPNIVIELSSHTDGKGAEKYNLDLSQKRAESCVNYLVNEKGIPKERMVAKGYGKSVPV